MLWNETHSSFKLLLGHDLLRSQITGTTVFMKGNQFLAQLVSVIYQEILSELCHVQRWSRKLVFFIAYDTPKMKILGVSFQVIHERVNLKLIITYPIYQQLNSVRHVNTHKKM